MEKLLIAVDELNEHLRTWISDSDLIIYDDINSQTSISNEFLKESLSYVIENNKAIMLTSNEPINLIDSVPDYIPYDNPISDNFLLLDKLQAKSQRQAWWESLENNNLGKANNDTKITELFESNKNSAAGIVFKTKNTNLDDLKNNIVTKYNINKDRLKVVSSPIIKAHKEGENMVPDQISPGYYVDDMHDYDYLLMKVTEDSEANQLIQILPKIHNTASKVILVTENINSLGKMLDSAINFCKSADRQKLTDRLKNIFPENLLN